MVSFRRESPVPVGRSGRQEGKEEGGVRITLKPCVSRGEERGEREGGGRRGESMHKRESVEGWARR